MPACLTSLWRTQITSLFCSGASVSPWLPPPRYGVFTAFCSPASLPPVQPHWLLRRRNTSHSPRLCPRCHRRGDGSSLTLSSPPHPLSQSLLRSLSSLSTLALSDFPHLGNPEVCTTCFSSSSYTVRPRWLYKLLSPSHIENQADSKCSTLLLRCVW